MAVGFRVTQQAVNDSIGQLALNARLLARSVDQLVTNLSGASDAQLKALPAGGSPEVWTDADVTALRAAAQVLVDASAGIKNGLNSLNKVTGVS